MTTHGSTHSLNACAPEVLRVVQDDFEGDLSRLVPGEYIMAYIEHLNCTETWEVIEVGATFDTVIVRLIDLIEETSAA
ncbi:MAG TPA: hypothetical protein VF897_23470 [Roseiflexaceae bacterium]